MKQFPIAIQVYSIRDAAEADFVGTMKAIKEMGYSGVELAGTYGMTVVEMKKILDEIGLELVSAHVGLDLIAKDEVLADYAAAGIKFMAIPWFTGPKTREELESAIAQIREGCERCKAYGIQLLYHNHDFEFEKIDGEYVLDSYYARIPADLLQTELDVCWVNVGGEKPPVYVRKYTGRAPIVHLKDFAGQKAENMYGLIGAGGTERKEDPSSKFEFRPVGYGNQDVPSIVEAAEDAGAEWLVVEQDQPSMGKSPLECVAMSMEYLKSITPDCHDANGKCTKPESEQCAKCKAENKK